MYSFTNLNLGHRDHFARVDKTRMIHLNKSRVLKSGVIYSSSGLLRQHVTSRDVPLQQTIYLSMHNVSV